MLKTPSSVSRNNPGFLFKNKRPQPAILRGIFDYNSAFAAFLSATNQKKHTADIVSLFAHKLQQRQISVSEDSTIKVADMGCANSTTCLGYMNQIGHPAGFEYLGVDINDTFLEQAATILSQNPLIKKHTLVNGDVLSKGLSAIPSVSPQSFDLIFVSHLAYYLKNEAYSQAFVDNTLSLLKENGIAIFLHEASTYYFRSKYNSNYKNTNAPEMLRESAKGLLEDQGQFNEIFFTSKLIFEEMSEELWEAAKNPDLYKNFAHLPEFIDNLNKLAFIVQCDLSKLSEEGSLANYIDEIEQLLGDNNNCFNLTTCMQILVSPKNTHIAEIKEVLGEVDSASSLLTATCTPLCYS